MKRWIPLLLLFLACLPAPAAVQPKPKLVLIIAVDQFRYDYLTRFRSDYKEGLARLLDQGAVFVDARLDHFPTVTATGHSVLLTGAMPSASGIIGNEWFDRETGTQVTSVSDSAERLLGGGEKAAGASPRRQLVSTVGDQMKMVHPTSKVIGISVKDRSAILTAGSLADAAYWFDSRTGNFVSSTYYFSDLPRWVMNFNAKRMPDQYRGAAWMGRALPLEIGPRLYSGILTTPIGNDLVEAFAERAIEAEQLGLGDRVDLLSISFSSNDYVGHEFGPDSPEVREISRRTDEQLGSLLRFVDSKIGLRNVLVVFAADHGVAPLPKPDSGGKMHGGRMTPHIVRDTLQRALSDKYGAGEWIAGPAEHSVYLNLALVREKALDAAEVRNTAAQAARGIPHVMRVYTHEQLMAGAVHPDTIGRRVMNGFFPARAADLYILLESYWLFGSLGTTHGTAFSYDSHVPLIFMGPGLRPGRHFNPVVLNDVAPTLCALLEIETPSGSTGRVLSEIFGTND